MINNIPMLRIKKTSRHCRNRQNLVNAKHLTFWKWLSDVILVMVAYKVTFFYFAYLKVIICIWMQSYRWHVPSIFRIYLPWILYHSFVVFFAITSLFIGIKLVLTAKDMFLFSYSSLFKGIVNKAFIQMLIIERFSNWFDNRKKSDWCNEKRIILPFFV